MKTFDVALIINISQDFWMALSKILPFPLESGHILARLEVKSGLGFALLILQLARLSFFLSLWKWDVLEPRNLLWFLWRTLKRSFQRGDTERAWKAADYFPREMCLQSQLSPCLPLSSTGGEKVNHFPLYLGHLGWAQNKI